VDNMNVLFLTPLPGTRLWRQLEAEGRIAMNTFPDDWKYYTLNYPVARYKYLSQEQVIHEMIDCNGTYYSGLNIVTRMWKSLVTGRNPLFSLVSNLSSRRNSRLHAQAYRALAPAEWGGKAAGEAGAPQLDLVDTWESVTQRMAQVVAALKLQLSWLFRQS
jgi:hypothetical protein